MKSKLFLVAMVAASMIACGSGGDTVTTTDTFVSPDSSLGDNQKPDNFIPPDMTPPDLGPQPEAEEDAISSDNASEATDDSTLPDSCAEYHKYDNIKMYCDTGTLDGECTSKFVINANGTCSFTCFGEVAHVGCPANGLKINDTPLKIEYPADSPYVVCTPTS